MDRIFTTVRDDVVEFQKKCWFNKMTSKSDYNPNIYLWSMMIVKRLEPMVLRKDVVSFWCDPFFDIVGGFHLSYIPDNTELIIGDTSIGISPFFQKIHGERCLLLLPINDQEADGYPIFLSRDTPLGLKMEISGRDPPEVFCTYKKKKETETSVLLRNKLIISRDRFWKFPIEKRHNLQKGVTTISFLGEFPVEGIMIVSFDSSEITNEIVELTLRKGDIIIYKEKASFYSEVLRKFMHIPDFCKNILCIPFNDNILSRDIDSFFNLKGYSLDVQVEKETNVAIIQLQIMKFIFKEDGVRVSCS